MAMTKAERRLLRVVNEAMAARDRAYQALSEAETAMKTFGDAADAAGLPSEDEIAEMLGQVRELLGNSSAWSIEV